MNWNMPKASPNDVSIFGAGKSTFVGFHRNQGKVAFAGPLFPFGGSATAKDSFQVGAIGGCQAKLGDQALRKVRLQSCDRDPAVAGFIERIEGIAAAKRTAGAGKARAVRLIKLVRAFVERNE